jgi:hypothetical protein
MLKNLAYAVLVGASLVGVSLSACSSTSTPTPGDADAASAADAAPDTRTSDAATADSSDGSTACNALVNAASEAMASTVKSAAPTATGGTIVDGTYFLTDITLYDPAGTASAPEPAGIQVTLAITGNLMESVQTYPDDSSDTFAETFVVNGTALNRTLTCPKAAPDLSAVYSAAGNKLTIYETDPKTSLVAGSVYVKQ